MKILLVMSMLTMLGGAAYGQFILASDAPLLVPAKIDLSEDETWSGIQLRSDREFFLTNPEKHPQIFCLAQNIYFESSIDNIAGMAGVADVTLNRVADSRYGNTVCDVIHHAVYHESWKTKKDPDLPDELRVYNPVLHKCAFSWFCDGKPDTIPYGRENWIKAQMVAWNMYMNGEFRGISEGSTHYHATYATFGQGDWRKDRGMQLVGRIGAHIFYRWN
tara:strand:+ start:703 stop:1359 length:657 start_codon:yes stop_codon:yes gene_type:complete